MSAKIHNPHKKKAACYVRLFLTIRQFLKGVALAHFVATGFNPLII
jgi:hypothetical protein